MFRPSAIELVTFDFDGTLAELTIDFAAMRREIHDLAVGYGLDWESAQGDYVLEMIDDLARKNGRLGRRFAAEAHELIVEREMAAARAGRLFPGVRQVLARLGGLGLGLAIITRNCRRAVTAVFPDIADWCHLFVPREDAPKPKPAPEHMRRVLTGLAVAADRCLVVGDHPIDVAAARSVGAWACGITTGRIDAAGFKEADLVLGSLEELVELFHQVRR